MSRIPMCGELEEERRIRAGEAGGQGKEVNLVNLNTVVLPRHVTERTFHQLCRPIVPHPRLSEVAKAHVRETYERGELRHRATVPSKRRFERVRGLL